MLKYVWCIPPYHTGEDLGQSSVPICSSSMEWGGAWALLCCVLLYQSSKLDRGPTEPFQKKNTNHTPSPYLLHEIVGS